MTNNRPEASTGVVVDTFHPWWDPERVQSYQVGDWITPLPADSLLARGMMGDGHVDLAAVGNAGYRGDVELVQPHL